MYIVKNIDNTSILTKPQMSPKTSKMTVVSCSYSVTYLMGNLLIVLALENRVCWIACALRLTHNKINAEKRVRENRIYGVQKQKSYWGWVNSGKLSCITFLSHTCKSYCCELFFSLCFEAFFKTSSLQVTQMNSLTDEEWGMSGNAVNVSYL